MRRAVIDIGTNTLLLLIVEPAPDGRLRPVVDLCRFGRLGQGLDATGSFADEAIERSLAICREYRRVMDEAGVSSVMVIATQATREAKNAAAFVEPAQAILGATIDVIPGEREAELAYLAVAHTFPDLAGKPYLVVDVGGGSTEIVATDGTRVVSAVSVPIGAVRLRERHLRHDPPTAEDRAALDADIAGHLRELDLPRGAIVVGTAGTATTMASVALQLPAYDPDAITGLRLEPVRIRALLDDLMARTIEERRGLPGMVIERADVLPAGIAIFAAIVARVGAPALIACDRGIRWGIAYSGRTMDQ
jgi:exopolyphosphatase/guanosine-5'-triphosphate,3'-diphosphate pyrophosphatase